MLGLRPIWNSDYLLSVHFKQEETFKSVNLPHGAYICGVSPNSKKRFKNYGKDAIYCNTQLVVYHEVSLVYQMICSIFKCTLITLLNETHVRKDRKL